MQVIFKIFHLFYYTLLKPLKSTFNVKYHKHFPSFYDFYLLSKNFSFKIAFFVDILQPLVIRANLGDTIELTEH